MKRKAERTSRMSGSRAVRLLGVLTMGYGGAILAQPRLLAAPCGLTRADGSVSAEGAALTKVLGARDLASGASMVLAPSGAVMSTAVGLRAASDFVDAAVLGTGLAEASSRRKAALAGGGWGLVCALAGFAAHVAHRAVRDERGR